MIFQLGGLKSAYGILYCNQAQLRTLAKNPPTSLEMSSKLQTSSLSQQLSDISQAMFVLQLARNKKFVQSVPCQQPIHISHTKTMLKLLTKPNYKLRIHRTMLKAWKMVGTQGRSRAVDWSVEREMTEPRLYPKLSIKNSYQTKR